MNIGDAIHGNLPPEFFDLATSALTKHSVALAKMPEKDAKKFLPLGSGVLVRKAGRKGILTAHHCLHDNKVFIAPAGHDRIAIAMKGFSGLVLNSGDMYEHPLAFPADLNYVPWTPDLTYIELLPGAALDQIAKVGAFIDLDRPAEELVKKWRQPKQNLVHVGFPILDGGINYPGNNVQWEIMHMALIGATRDDSFVEKNGWDFLESEAYYSEMNSELPENFSGISGGAIWAMTVKVHGPTEFSIIESDLVGINLHQSQGFGNFRKIRGHFIRSIYDLAWQKIFPWAKEDS